MVKIIVIVGLPGSGKTTFAKTLGLPVYEDVGTQTYPEPTTDMVLDTVLGVSSSVREFITDLYRGHDIEWVFFENNPDQCIINIQLGSRDKKVLPGSVKYFSQKYSIPAGAVTKPVYK